MFTPPLLLSPYGHRWRPGSPDSSTRRLADFAKDVRKVVQRQRLPSYWLELYRTEGGEEALRFSARAVLPTDHPGYAPKRLPRVRIAARRDPEAATPD